MSPHETGRVTGAGKARHNDHNHTAAGSTGGTKGTTMKSITSIVCALAFLGTTVLANAESCCDKAKKAGKDCSHKCCVAAKKDGKTCEKCNPKKDK